MGTGDIQKLAVLDERIREVRCGMEKMRVIGIYVTSNIYLFLFVSYRYFILFLSSGGDMLILKNA